MLIKSRTASLTRCFAHTEGQVMPSGSRLRMNTKQLELHVMDLARTGVEANKEILAHLNIIRPAEEGMSE